MIGESSPSPWQDKSDAHTISPFRRRTQSRPRLGDFSSLRLASTYSEPTHHIVGQYISPESRSSPLGDFSRVFNQFQAPELAPTQVDGAGLTDSNLATRGIISVVSSVSDSEREPSTKTIKKILRRTSSSTHLSKRAEQQLYLSNLSSDLTTPSNQPRNRSAKKKEASSKLKRVLKNEVSDEGLVIPAFGAARTTDEIRASLSRRLTKFRMADRRMARKFPQNASRGLHVFLDMSNIEISFQTALRKKYGLADSARLTSLPRLNLQLLTDLLLRGRTSRGLHVGCSIVPGRKEPRFVQELRELGYQVDVRERKRVEHGGAVTPLSKPAKLSIRYVEDLVDETLQTRIAEAVMEHFQEQGTIVLATGDAKPAQYSDGFFRYVERALRMGWNVELVAWHGSLASSWKDADWAGLWKDRFRVIELDSFIDDLLGA